LKFDLLLKLIFSSYTKFADESFPANEIVITKTKSMRILNQIAVNFSHLNFTLNVGASLKKFITKYLTEMEIEVGTDVLEKFEEVKLHSEEIEITEVTQNELGSGSIEIPAPEQLKRNSLSKFFRLKGLKSSTSKENLSEPSKSNSIFRIFGKNSKGKKTSTDTEKSTMSSRTSSMRSLVNCQILPWIGRRASQVNLRNPSDEMTVKSDAEDEANEIATNSEIF
jgi:hypothetical protein